MKVLVSVPYGCGFVFDRLREAGHELIKLDHEEVSFNEAVDTFERERPDVFLWDPGAPVPNSFSLVERLMRALDHPPTVLFCALQREWSEYYTSKTARNIRVVGMSVEDYTPVFQEIVAQ